MGIPHVLVLPYPAQGHVLPMMELSLNLVQNGLRVTFVNSDFNHTRVVRTLAEVDDGSIREGIRLVSIPDGMEAEDDRNDVGKLTEAMPKGMKGRLEELIREGQITCMVTDMTVAWAPEIAVKMGIKNAIFFPAAAASLALIFSIPKLADDGIVDEIGTPLKNEMLKLSAQMPPLKPEAVPWTAFESKETQRIFFDMFRRCQKFIKSAERLICNSTYDLEPAAFDLVPNLRSVGPLLASNRPGKRPVGSFWHEDSSCLKWLDEQQPSSVIYVAFGSFTIFNKAQFQELAMGLDLTNRPFLWVVRPDMAEQANEAYPAGFLKRVADRVRIVSWAPQQQVLSHPAIACFVSHCGWNSTMEGVSNGMRFLCWPYFADQVLNETYICDVWKTGLRFNKDAKGFINREEIVTKVQKLLSDESFKEKAIELRGKTVSSINDGGRSYKNFKELIGWIKA